MGKKVIKLFLDTMLRAAVIILAVAIVVMLVMLARTVSKSKKSDASDTGNKTSIVTRSQIRQILHLEVQAMPRTTQTHQRMTSFTGRFNEDANAGNGKDAKVVVLNASGVSGVAIHGRQHSQRMDTHQ
ncbi:MAG: hypothetical protein ACLTDF_13355 [Coprococcus sp.]